MNTIWMLLLREALEMILRLLEKETSEKAEEFRVEVASLHSKVESEIQSA